MAASSEASWPARTTSLICITASGGIDAMVFAMRSAVSKTSPSATTSLTSPIARASRAATGSPVSSMRIARNFPTARVSRCVPPAPGMIPTRTSGCPKLAPSPATMMSACIASSHPPPNAYPLTAAITGLGHDALADVLAVEKSDERARRILEPPLNDVLAIADLPFAQPLRHIAQKIGHAIGVIENDHSLNQRAIDQDRAEVGTGTRFGIAVLRDEADERNARVNIDPLQHRFQDVAADVIEVDVDSIRTGSLQRFFEIRRFVVDADVASVLVHDAGALLIRPGNPDHAAAFDFCDLSGD